MDTTSSSEKYFAIHLILHHFHNYVFPTEFFPFDTQENGDLIF